MKKSLFTIISLVLLLSVFSTNALAAKAEENIGEELSQEFIRIAKENPSNEELINALSQEGWELVSHTPSISPKVAEPAGCVSLDHLVFTKTSGGVTKYQYRVRWEWETTSTCKPNSGSGKVVDLLAAGVVDEKGNSVNVQAENPTIAVYDQSNVPYPYNGGASDIFNSGVTFTITDGFDDSSYIGSTGFVIFGSNKPSSGKTYYLKSKYIHTSASSNVSVKEFKIAYPWAVSLSFSGSKTVDQLEKVQQTVISYN